MPSGLNNIVSDTVNQTTSLPGWYDAAQQNLTSQAQTAAGQVPGIGQTAVGGFANQLNTAASPFAQGQTTLNQIATGAANPWITDTTTGQVTPNTNTAMGGLFQAQNQQLNQLLPNFTAPVQGAGIASGSFGSLRDQTAINKAKGDALATLQAEQMKAALQNQATGAQAASGLGSLGAQQGQTSIATGEFQQNSPLAGITDLANILNAQKVGNTISKSTDYSPLSQATGLITALGGVSGAGGILGQLFGSTVRDPKTGQMILNKGVLGSGGMESVFKDLFKNVNIGGGSGGGTLPPTEGDNPDSGDYNGVDYGNTGPVLPPTTDDYLDSGDYNGVDYGNYGGDYGDAP